ncbi:FKBP12-associated protein [Vermiconidia calcicola]|uniref:FKBP12-associated protein n=1 Tax=Vermiconidia calcicola TaxID=1690605 RepID=A0ACC3NF75_9PEZI|nr:FKBP12-associated protein [Vermiconidia calcicola]
MENICHAPFPCKEDKPCQSKIYITCDCQAQKQEMKCGASKTSEGNNGKSLPCNDDHVDGGDHIPYSTETLNLFSQHMKWAQTQEREFRVFASSPEERRLRFKPMQSHQRAFIHALAEDFAIDSESMDPEPHRHVMIWKTPRFVAAPNKTLAEALRIRQAQRSATASANVSDNESARAVKPKPVSSEPYNAFVISNPRFGLTVDEIRAELSTQLHPGIALTFDVEFLPSEEVVLRAVTKSLSSEDLQQLLQSIKTPLSSAIAAKGYGTSELCNVDASLNITRRESESTSGDGWSKVAAKGSKPRIALSNGSVAGSNAFSALGSNKVTFSKKKPVQAKPKKEVVVDDWEAAEVAEEEKERATSGTDEDESVVPPSRTEALGSSDQSKSSSIADDAESVKAGDGKPLNADSVNAGDGQPLNAETDTPSSQDWAAQVEDAEEQ